MKPPFVLTALTTLVALVGVTATTSAAIVYTDLTDANTDVTGIVGSNPTDSGWLLRMPFASNGTIYQGLEGSAADLTTTLTGLIPALEYDVYTYFWDTSSDDNDWGVQAGLVQGSLTTFIDSSADVTLASLSTYSVAPTVFVEDDRTMYQAFLGTIAADSNGELSIFLGATAGAPGTELRDRTWVDGVGVKAIPEPSTMILFLTAGVVLFTTFLRRRTR